MSARLQGEESARSRRNAAAFSTSVLAWSGSSALLSVSASAMVSAILPW
jgi:hypothetical protein